MLKRVSTYNLMILRLGKTIKRNSVWPRNINQIIYETITTIDLKIEFVTQILATANLVYLHESWKTHKYIEKKVIRENSICRWQAYIKEFLNTFIKLNFRFHRILKINSWQAKMEQTKASSGITVKCIHELFCRRVDHSETRFSLIGHESIMTLNIVESLF